MGSDAAAEAGPVEATKKRGFLGYGATSLPIRTHFPSQEACQIQQKITTPPPPQESQLKVQLQTTMENFPGEVLRGKY